VANTIKFGEAPSEKDIAWFVTHIGHRTHYLPNSIGGKGWRFRLCKDNPCTEKGIWHLTLEDDKMMSYYLLVR